MTTATMTLTGEALKAHLAFLLDHAVKGAEPPDDCHTCARLDTLCEPHRQDEEDRDEFARVQGAVLAADTDVEAWAAYLGGLARIGGAPEEIQAAVIAATGGHEQ